MKSPQFAPARSQNPGSTFESRAESMRQSSHESQKNFNEKLSNLKNALTSIKTNLNHFKVNSGNPRFAQPPSGT